MSHNFTCDVNMAEEGDPKDPCGEPACWEMDGVNMCSECFHDILLNFSVGESALVAALGEPDSASAAGGAKP